MWNNCARWTSLGMDICDDMIETSRHMSTRPSSTIHRNIPIKDIYYDASWGPNTGETSSSGLYDVTIGVSADFGISKRSCFPRYVSTFLVAALTYCDTLKAHASTPLLSSTLCTRPLRYILGGPTEPVFSSKYFPISFKISYAFFTDAKYIISVQEDVLIIFRAIAFLGRSHPNICI